MTSSQLIFLLIVLCVVTGLAWLGLVLVGCGLAAAVQKVREASRRVSAT